MDLDDEAADFLSFGKDLVEQPALKTSGTSTIDFGGLLENPLRLQEDLAEGMEN